MKILMHMCCAPCAIYPVKHIKELGHTVDGLYYNPNIHPHEEFIKREKNVEKLADMYSFFVHYLPDYEEEKWDEFEVDNNKKCSMCYDLRLEKTFKFAKEKNYDAVTTSLLISPYQNHDLIIRKANKFSEKYNITFYYEDFRPFYKKGQLMAKGFDIYCQRYCGCSVSLLEAIDQVSKNFKRSNLDVKEV